METSLKDFLKQKAAVYKAESEKNRAVIEEWQNAVNHLFDQVHSWLAAADPEGIIRPEYGQIEVNEPGVGRYQIRRLNLRAFGKWIGLIPKARITIKQASPQQKDAPEQSTGRVDITDEIRRFVLYRFTRDGSDEWFIDDTSTDRGLKPLTSELFEAALLSYFR